MNNTMENEYEVDLVETRSLRQVMSMPWAILDSNLLDIMNIAARSNLDIEKATAIAEERRQDRFKAISGERLSGTRSVVVTADGVAVIPVFDSLFRRGGWFSSISGAMSMEQIESDFSRAMQSKNVKSVLLDVDSPGGEVNYTDHLANTIYQARGMDKDIQTFCSGMMASAAFWIGSSAKKRTATPGAFIGSVGVISSYISYKKAEEKAGIKRIKIVSSMSPNKALDPETPEGEKEIKAMVDYLGDQFVGAISRNLAISEEKVKSWKGGLLIGQQAKDGGMVDAIGYFSDVMTELSSAPQTKQFKAAAAPLASETDDEPVVIPEEEPNDEPETEPENVDVPGDEDLENDDQDDDDADDESNDDPEASEIVSDTIIAENEVQTDMADKTDDKKGPLAALAASMGFDLTPKPGASNGTVVVKSAREIALEQKARQSFMASADVTSKVTPAAHKALDELYATAQETGCEDKVEAFVASLTPHKLTQDRLPVNGKYNVAVDPTTDDDEDEEEIKQLKQGASDFTGSDKSDAAA